MYIQEHEINGIISYALNLKYHTKSSQCADRIDDEIYVPTDRIMYSYYNGTNQWHHVYNKNEAFYDYASTYLK